MLRLEELWGSQFLEKTEKSDRRKRQATAPVTIDRGTEMLRAACLFFVLSKCLTLIAICFLFLSNDAMVNSLLVVDAKKVPTLEEIPRALTITKVTALMQHVMISVAGVAGFALLNRYLLFFYGTSSVVTVLAMMAPVMSNLNETDAPRSALFLDLKDGKSDSKTNVTIDLLQATLKCCGSVQYNYEDRVDRPGSCCANKTEGEQCLPEMAFKRLCETNRTLMTSFLQEQGYLVYLMGTLGFYALFLLTEGAVAFYMFKRVSALYAENSMSM